MVGRNRMTDLKTVCPKCNMKLSRYIHSVDRYGMGDYIPNGKYQMVCEPSGYMNTDKAKEKYCGFVTPLRRESFFNLTDVQIIRLFGGVETGGVRQCKHCEGWYQDDYDVLVEHLVTCEVYNMKLKRESKK